MMEVVKICQICQEFKCLKPVIDLGEDIFKYVFAHVAYSQHSLICDKCFETIKKLFDFKKTCLEVESRVNCIPKICKEEAEIKIEEKVGVNIKSDEKNNMSICRICSEVYEDSTITVSIAEPGVKLMINKFLPELNLDMVNDPVSCIKCFHMVEQYFTMLQCLEDKKVKHEAVNDEEIHVCIDGLKQEELDIKVEQQESNSQDCLDDDLDSINTPSLIKDLYEDDTPNELFMAGKHTEKKPFKCDICDNRFVFQGSLTRHIKIHADKKPIKCDICDKHFTVKKSLLEHTKIHTGEKPFQCDICNKRFIQKSTMIDHTKRHTEEKPFQCNICDRRFSVKNDLTRHTKLHGDKPFKCDICDKRFAQKNSSIDHTKIHTGEKPFKCGICEKRFTLKCTLNVHSRIHTGKKPYKCDICDKRFTQKSSLIDHTRVHTGEKPFKCDVCDKIFSHKGNFRDHAIKHTEEKPFKCGFCDKRFRARSSLKDHTREHMGEKSFNCYICDRGFNRKYNLKKHIRTHTGERLSNHNSLQLSHK